MKLEPCRCGSGPARGPGQYTQASFSGVELMRDTHKFYVWCGTCGRRTGDHDTEAEAVEVWNERPRTLKEIAEAGFRALGDKP